MLSDSERRTLEQWARRPKTAQRLAWTVLTILELCDAPSGISICPSSWLGAFVVLGDEAAQLAGETGHRGENPSREQVSLHLREPELDLVQPGSVGRRINLHIRMGDQEVGDLRRLMGRQVVGNDVDLARRGLRVHDLLEERDELVAGTPLGRLSPHKAALRLERGVERQAHHQSHLTALANAFVESFNGKFRDECLNEHRFLNLAHAIATIEGWRADYNTVRPRSSLGNRTPEKFAKFSMGARRLPPPRLIRAR
jgi:Integrase core domain